MCWIAIIAVAGITLFMVWASADVGSGIYLKSLCRATTRDKVVALTFDDGPHAEHTPRVLDVLKEHNTPATFFVVGSNVERSPELVRRMVHEGHNVANHTYSHRGTLPISSYRRVCAELNRCNEAIATTTRRRTMLFRPPFGVTNPIIGRAVRELGLQSIGWSIRSLDTISHRSREEVCQRVIRRLRGGDIILLHDRCEDADKLARMIITQATSRGYRFVSLEELLNVKAYED